MAAYRKQRNIGSIIIGLSVAIATSLLTIDWTKFEFNKEWPKLVICAIIAAGGFLSRLKEVPAKLKKKKTDGNDPAHN